MRRTTLASTAAKNYMEDPPKCNLIEFIHHILEWNLYLVYDYIIWNAAKIINGKIENFVFPRLTKLVG